MTDIVPVKPIKPKRKFRVFQDASGEWRWHAFSTGNKKITFQGESHPSKAKAVRAVKQEWKALGLPGEPVIEL